MSNRPLLPQSSAALPSGAPLNDPVVDAKKYWNSLDFLEDARAYYKAHRNEWGSQGYAGKHCRMIASDGLKVKLQDEEEMAWVSLRIHDYFVCEKVYESNRENSVSLIQPYLDPNPPPMRLDIETKWVVSFVNIQEQAKYMKAGAFEDVGSGSDAAESSRASNMLPALMRTRTDVDQGEGSMADPATFAWNKYTILRCARQAYKARPKKFRDSGSSSICLTITKSELGYAEGPDAHYVASRVHDAFMLTNMIGSKCRIPRGPNCTPSYWMPAESLWYVGSNALDEARKLYNVLPDRDLIDAGELCGQLAMKLFHVQEGPLGAWIASQIFDAFTEAGMWNHRLQKPDLPPYYSEKEVWFDNHGNFTRPPWLPFHKDLQYYTKRYAELAGPPVESLPVLDISALEPPKASGSG